LILGHGELAALAVLGILTIMSDAVQLVADVLAWLRNSYGEHRFFQERDIVWTVQRQIAQWIVERHLPFRVFNDHPVVPGRRRSLTADIAIVDRDSLIEVTMEFKYEPSHVRKDIDIWPSKFTPTVVFWGKEGVAGDVSRIQTFAAERRARFACSVFIDEGGYFHRRYPEPHPLTKWLEWGNDVWVLYSEATASMSN
jgi:hypothetical protein